MINSVEHGASETFPFFVGAGRSGTTLLRAMFDSHPELAIPGESVFVAQLGRARRRRTYEGQEGFRSDALLADLLRWDRIGRKWGLSEQQIRHSYTTNPVLSYSDAIRRLYALYAASKGKARYGDKTPGYVTQLPLLAELFPEGRFVHIIRDGRDVALSQLDFRQWGPQAVDEAALNWKRQVRRGRRDGRRLGPHRYREIKYEDLVEDPAGSLQHLCSWLGMSFDDMMLRYFERAADVAGTTPHFKNLYRPPTKGLRDWRRQMPAGDAASFEALAGDLLIEFGYEVSSETVPLGMRLSARLRSLSIRSSWALSQSERAARRVLRKRPASGYKPARRHPAQAVAGLAAEAEKEGD